jgi:hypothetical protein
MEFRGLPIKREKTPLEIAVHRANLSPKTSAALTDPANRDQLIAFLNNPKATSELISSSRS